MSGKTRTIHHEAGSGNVFADLGVSEPDQALVKADLLNAIIRELAKRDLRQVEIGRLLDIPQPKVSLLLRGRTAGFSTDYLMRLLNRLGQSIRIVVYPTARGFGSISVVRDRTATRPERSGVRESARAVPVRSPVQGVQRKVARRKVAKKK